MVEEEKCDADDDDAATEIERKRCVRAHAIMSIRKLNTLGRIMTPNRTIGLGGGGGGSGDGRPHRPWAQ